jgi:hypothetical protein
MWRCGNLALWFRGNLLHMAYELGWRPEADAAMDALEADPSLSAVVEAVDRTLGRLEVDPFDPRLGTIQFQTPEFGGVCATPIRWDDWYVFWQRGPAANDLVIILIHQLKFGRQP